MKSQPSGRHAGACVLLPAAGVLGGLVGRHRLDASPRAGSPYWTWSPSERGASITRCSTVRSRRWVGSTVSQPRGGWPVICHRLRCVVPRFRAKQTEHPAHALTRNPGRPTPQQGQPATDPRGRCLSHPSPAVKPSGGRGASPCHEFRDCHTRGGGKPRSRSHPLHRPFRAGHRSYGMTAHD